MNEPTTETPISVDMVVVHSNTEFPLLFAIDARIEKQMVESMMKHDPLCVAAENVCQEPIRPGVFVPYKSVYVDGAFKNENLYGYKGESMFEFPVLDNESRNGIV